MSLLRRRESSSARVISQVTEIFPSFSAGSEARLAGLREEIRDTVRHDIWRSVI